MNHPVINQIERTGYPTYSPIREVYGIDGLSNETYVGDEILVYNDEFFLVETLGSDGVEILELLGAAYEIAK